MGGFIKYLTEILLVHKRGFCTVLLSDDKFETYSTSIAL